MTGILAIALPVHFSLANNWFFYSTYQNLTNSYS